jgi:thiol-disulfide isomerase/thioredoxin
MRKIIALWILVWPHLLLAQHKGIAFEVNQSWQQVLQKAKAENKLIFVDCYASWCGPCKWMDHQVYDNDVVGDFMNKTFITVKVQMDTTGNDASGTCEWYATAHEIGKQYHVKAYPTFLFFSSDGWPLHKAIGAVDVTGFLTLARAAINPHQQYYTLLTQFQQGIRQYDRMAYLANSAKLYDDSLSDMITIDYLHHLGELPSKELWTKENIDFIGTYVNVVHNGDNLFQRYLHDRPQIDSIIGSKGYADQLIKTVIYNEEILPRLDAGMKTNSEPNWHFMAKMIKQKYGAHFAKLNLLIAKEEYYRNIKKWDKYAKYFVLHLQNSNINSWPPGAATSAGLNNDAFEVFKYSNRKKELKEALTWVNRALSMIDGARPMNIYRVHELDTKASLLYKLGRKNEAVIYEEKAHEIGPDEKDIQENYEKMKNGQFVW